MSRAMEVVGQDQMPDGDLEVPLLAAALAREIAAARSGSIPAAAREKARTCLLDFFGCAFDAHGLPWSRQAAALAEGNGPCTIIASADGTWPGDAAFANAVAGHGLVREDMHVGAVAHLGVVVLPALLALAEQRDRTVAEVLDSAVIGYEVGAKLGRAIVSPEFSRFFRPTGFVGPAAAAAACAVLLGLDEARIQSALSLAANMASGLNQWPHSGADDMFFHPGVATRNGLTAARLAELGAEGSAAALDGEAGLLTAMRPDRNVPPVHLFSDEPEILSVFFKALPVCNFAQTPALAAIRLAADTRINPRAIRTVRVRVSRAAKVYPGCDHAGPFSRTLQAKMSIQYAVASALLDAGVDEASYADLDDKARRALADKTTVETEDSYTAVFPQQQSASVEILMEDGSTFAGALPDVLPAKPAEVRVRFRRAAGAVVGSDATQRIEALVDDPRGAARVASLMALTRCG